MSVFALPTPRSVSDGAKPLPLFIWLGVQLLSLLAVAARVPFTPHFPTAQERLAVDLLVMVQVAASALLFPVILSGTGTAISAVLSGLTFVAFAAALAAVSPAPAGRAAAYVALWLAALAALLRVFRSQMTQLIASSVIAAWVLGAPVVWYLRAEFAPPTMPPADYLRDWLGTAAWSPLAGALAQLHGGPSVCSWIAPAAVLSFAAGRFFIARRQKRAVFG
jgi:hypothetical protein